MSSPFESYDDLEDADERLQAADPAERRVAIIALGHSGDPAAVALLANMVADPDAGVRQQVAMALGEFDGPEAANGLVKLLVDPERTWRLPRPTAWPNSRIPPALKSFFRWSSTPTPSSAWARCAR